MVTPYGVIKSREILSRFVSLQQSFGRILPNANLSGRTVRIRQYYKRVGAVIIKGYTYRTRRGKGKRPTKFTIQLLK